MSEPAAPAAEVAADDAEDEGLTLTAHGCTPSSIEYQERTTCRYEVQNHTDEQVMVDLEAAGVAGKLTPVEADLDATIDGTEARVDGLVVPPSKTSPFRLVPTDWPTFVPPSDLRPGSSFDLSNIRW